jgi:hypothetical protein
MHAEQVSSTEHTETAPVRLLVGKVVLCPLPDRLEYIRLGEQELDIVICPCLRRQALKEHDHFLKGQPVS